MSGCGLTNIEEQRVGKETVGGCRFLMVVTQ